MEDPLASLSLEEAEEDPIQLSSEAVNKEKSYKYCLMGTFLTSSVVHFPAMRSTLANVWHPVGGIFITDLENGRFLFRFYFAVDVDRVLSNGPWNFNSHLLIPHRLQKGEDPLEVPLVEVNFWVIIHAVCRLLGVNSSVNLERCLGLPSIVGRNKKAAFRNLKERMLKRVSSWSSSLLSVGGKEILIKVVLQSLPLYAMSCFLLPSSLCKELEAITAKFWWQKKPGKSSLH